MSRDGKIALGAAMIMGAIFVLIDPKTPFWRVLTLLSMEIGLIIVTKELNWVNQRRLELSVIEGPVETESPSGFRLAACICLSLILVGWVAVETWPPPLAVSPVGNVQVIQLPPGVLPTPKGSILNLPLGAPPVPAKPKPKPKPKTKAAEPPKPLPEPPAIKIEISNELALLARDVRSLADTRKEVEDKLPALEPNGTRDKADKPFIARQGYWEQTKNQFRLGGYLRRCLDLTEALKRRKFEIDRANSLSQSCSNQPRDVRELSILATQFLALAQEILEPPDDQDANQ